MRIVVAMSGGVDSSVAAALLAEQGHDVVGVSMQLYDQSDGQTSFGSCCSIDDLHDARRVAAAIDIPHYIVNFEKQFDQQVVANFISEYAAGRTPLPSAHCNSDLKFGTLAERARELGAEGVATGPYARGGEGKGLGFAREGLSRRSGEAAKAEAMYVLALRPADQQVIVGPKASLEQVRLTASGVNWLIEEPAGALRVSAQIRHHHQAAP